MRMITKDKRASNRSLYALKFYNMHFYAYKYGVYGICVHK